MDTIYYVYGTNAVYRGKAKSKPDEIASATFGELRDVVAAAGAAGYTNVFARTKPLPFGAYRHDAPL